MGKFDGNKDKGTDTAEVADAVSAGAIEGAGAALEAGGEPRDVAAAAIGGAAAISNEVVTEADPVVQEAPVEEETLDATDKAIAAWWRKVSMNTPLSRNTVALNYVSEKLPLLKNLLKGDSE